MNGTQQLSLPALLGVGVLALVILLIITILGARGGFSGLLETRVIVTQPVETTY